MDTAGPVSGDAVGSASRPAVTDAAAAPVVTRLILQDFRSYGSLDLPLTRRLVALSGENGAGKTNLIEALSLLAPGRGLRRADGAATIRHGADRFAASATLLSGGAEHRLGIGLENDSGRLRRVCRIDGVDVASAAAFAEYLRVVWLTPELDGLFRGTPGDRRRSGRHAADPAGFPLL